MTNFEVRRPTGRSLCSRIPICSSSIVFGCRRHTSTVVASTIKDLGPTATATLLFIARIHLNGFEGSRLMGGSLEREATGVCIFINAMQACQDT